MVSRMPAARDAPTASSSVSSASLLRPRSSSSSSRRASSQQASSAKRIEVRAATHASAGRPRACPARECDLRESPPALFVQRPRLDTFARHLGDEGVHVLAHQVELVRARVGRVKRQLRGREREDEPAVTGVGKRIREDVPKERTIRIGVLAEEDDVGTVDHGHERRPGTRDCDAERSASRDGPSRSTPVFFDSLRYRSMAAPAEARVLRKRSPTCICSVR